MSLDSSSTLAEIQAQYVDNADYSEAGSTSKAKLFIQACRILLLKQASSAKQGEDSYAISVDAIERQLEEAQAWLSKNDDSGSNTRINATYLDFRRSRW